MTDKYHVDYDNVICTEVNWETKEFYFTFFGKDDEAPLNICLNCDYAWYQEDMESSDNDLTDFEYGLACQVED